MRMVQIRYLKSVTKYIKKWPKDAKIKFLKYIDKINKYGLETLIKTRDIKPFRQTDVQLYEFRPKKYRLFFTVINKTIWIVSGYKKEGKKTPKKEREKAINLIKELLQKHGSHRI